MRHLQRHLAVAASDAALPRCRSVLRRAQASTAFARSQNRHHSGSSIRSLQDAFRDPSSPFHIAPGTQGPASPDPPSEAELLHTNATNKDKMTEAAERARRTLIDLGYDPSSFWEQRIVWGDHDAFQHVNNVRYVRFFESSRVEWMVSLGRELGGEARARDMLTGRGVSLILKSISVDYKRPVVYPDTLLVAKRPRVVNRLPKTHFNLEGAAYSYRQGRVVTECDSVMVWYDYDKLAKCDPGEEARRVLLSRIALCAEQKQRLYSDSWQRHTS